LRERHSFLLSVRVLFVYRELGFESAVHNSVLVLLLLCIPDQTRSPRLAQRKLHDGKGGSDAHDIGVTVLDDSFPDGTQDNPRLVVY